MMAKTGVMMHQSAIDVIASGRAVDAAVVAFDWSFEFCAQA
jgi:hypothetical protein